MRSVVACFFIFLLPAIKSQDLNLDSLYTVLKNTKIDTVKIKTRVAIGETEPVMRISFWDSLVYECKVKAEKKDQSPALNKFYNLHLSTSYNNSGFISQQQGDVERAKMNFLNSLLLDLKAGNKKEIISPLNNIATIYQNKGDAKQAYFYHSKSLELKNLLLMQAKNPDEIKEIKRGIAQSYNNLGSNYEMSGNIPKAFEYYNKSLRIAEEIEHKKAQAVALGNLGLLYKLQGQRETAKGIFMKILSIQEKENQPYALATVYQHLGTFEVEDENYDLAKQYFEKARKIRVEINDKKGLAHLHLHIGVIEMKSKNYKVAEAEFLEAIKIFEATQDISSLTAAYFHYGELKFIEGKYADSKVYGEKALITASKTGYPTNISMASDLLYRTYKRLNMHNRALEHFSVFIQMRDSLNNESNKREGVKSELKYEFEKRAAADSVKVVEEKKVVQAQLRQEQTQRYSLYGGLGLVGVFALFMVNRFRVTNKQKKLIEEQKKIVEAQKHLVEEKQREILDSIFYARRIQRALITNETYINKNLKRLQG